MDQEINAEVIDTTSDDNTTQDNPSQVTKPDPVDEERTPWDIKVDKEAKRLNLTKQETATLIQKGLAADARMREAAEIRKKHEKLEEEHKSYKKRIREDLWGTLESDPDFEEDKDKWRENLDEKAEQRMLRKLQNAALSPEQRRLAELEAYYAKAEEDKNKTEAQKKAEENQKKAELQNKMMLNTVSKRITDTLQGEGGALPNDPRTVARMAYYMMGAIQHGKSLAPEAIAKAVKSDYQGDFQHFTKGATPEQILEIIGEEAFKALKRWDIEKIQGKKASPVTAQPSQPTKQRDPKSKYKNIEKKREEEFGSLYTFPDDY